MKAAEKRLLNSFLAWLGGDVFHREHAVRYLAAYRKFSSHSDEDISGHSEYEWDAFLAAMDAWAAQQISSLAPLKADEMTCLLPIPERRDPFTGLRRGHRDPPLSVNLAAEEALRQVPGIGASSARKILQERSFGGPFESLEDLVERGCITAGGLQLSRKYLNVSYTPTPAAESQIRDVDFTTYLRVQHALQPPPAKLKLSQVGIAELERAVDSLSGRKYWDQSRTLQDPLMQTYHVGRAQYQNIHSSNEDLLTTLLDNQGYLKILNRIVPRAKSSIWIQAPSLNLLHVKSLRGLLSALADAVEQNIDVRLLFDGNYKVGQIDSDDVAYLRARKVPCRAYIHTNRMHSRVILIDREHVICGSHSWSTTSMFHSEELGIYIHSPKLAKQQAIRFEHLWDAASADGQ